MSWRDFLEDLIKKQTLECDEIRKLRVPVKNLIDDNTYGAHFHRVKRRAIVVKTISKKWVNLYGAEVVIYSGFEVIFTQEN